MKPEFRGEVRDFGISWKECLNIRKESYIYEELAVQSLFGKAFWKKRVPFGVQISIPVDPIGFITYERRDRCKGGSKM